MSQRSASRRAGVALPLFSLRTRRDWGIGEFRDLPMFAAWCQAAGLSVVQVLPLNEMPPGETSPYSAMTGMALDPVYLALEDVPGWDVAEGLLPQERAQRVAVREAPRIRYATVRALKLGCLRRAFAEFTAHDLIQGTDHAQAFAAFCAAEAWWLDEYAWFRAMHAARDEAPWWTWPEAWQHPAAGECRPPGTEALEYEAQFRRWLQWLCAVQWTAARAAAPVAVYGDLPFMVAADSPDVWARQSEFRFDGTVGVPPDAFSDTGQDWGLPPWRAAVMQARGWTWMRARARRTAALYDGVRLDHLVGLYRMFVRPRPADGLAPGSGDFEPADEAAQLALGETLVRLYQSEGLSLIAEDLGVVPDFVRASLARMGVPGFKVLRWERAWDMPGQPFVDPSAYPERSVALTGTHDTETLHAWWDSLPVHDRAGVCALASVARHLVPGHERTASHATSTPLPASVRDAVLRAVYDCPSRLVVVPVQDVFGWEDRINRPATIADVNWTWRLPDCLDDWTQQPDWADRAVSLRAWAVESGRA